MNILPIRLCAALLCAVSFSVARAATPWTYDASANVLTDGAWTFATTKCADGIAVEKCVSGPTNAVAVLDFTKPMADASGAAVALGALSPTFAKGVRRLSEIHLPGTLKPAAIGTPYMSGAAPWLRVATVVHTDGPVGGWEALPVDAQGPRAHVWLRRAETLPKPPKPSRKNLVAHMGGNEVGKSNTLPAFEAALRERLSLECDVQLADDGTLYLGHDPRKDYVEAAKLMDLLAMVRPGDELQLDCKCERKGIEPVIAAVRESGAHRRGRILFAVYQPANALKIRQALPECDVWMPVKIRGKADPGNHGHTPVGIALNMKAERACGISLMWNEKVCTRDFLTELARLGVEVDVWTVDRPEVAAEALRRGARWVTTNKPIATAKYLEGE